MISAIAETNRTPFDFSEGESELVSGFNIEYGGALFALIFIREYGMIIFLSFLSSKFGKSRYGKCVWDTFQKKLASCGKCGIVRYCSRECQVGHWQEYIP